ncbi:hypothetical protein C8D88_11184 [Lentzea atacamensis]|uniref:Uncharacterized protein n=1 Tax=Lentzea atacamensis TaxID=531938 RepID=A0A316HTD6_9PSEU|nr:hypothetical protein [Lentzea atacamensis]PWK83199.1 hypothetical protein C8D88_11184 [Lentzea atacamensis]
MGETQRSEWVVRAYASLYSELAAWYRPYASRPTFNVRFKLSGAKQHDEHAEAMPELLGPVVLVAGRPVLEILLPLVASLTQADELRQKGADYPRLAEEVEHVGAQLSALLDAMRQDLGQDPVQLAAPLLVWA